MKVNIKSATIFISLFLAIGLIVGCVFLSLPKPKPLQINIIANDYQINVGDTCKIDYTVNVDSYNASYEVENESIAKIENQNILALNPGRTYLNILVESDGITKETQAVIIVTGEKYSCKIFTSDENVTFSNNTLYVKNGMGSFYYSVYSHELKRDLIDVKNTVETTDGIKLLNEFDTTIIIADSNGKIIIDFYELNFKFFLDIKIV